MISCIELSPYDAGTAYIAATRYKLDDYEPYLLVTRNYGKTWKRINTGIPSDDFTRVIRVDPVQQGLLYAGTETGLYVSYNDGAAWRRLQLNLPVSPIHELLVKGSDLIAGTHGRSVWVLDDLTPLREAAAKHHEPTYLFSPRDAVRILPGVDWTGNTTGWTNYLGAIGSGFLTEVTADGETVREYLDAGENPPRGAVIAYSLAETPDAPISITFKNAQGDEIRSFTSRLADDPPRAKELRAPANVGGNRFVWDLRHASITKIEGTDPISENALPGPFVVPGPYSVTLKAGDRELTQPFNVVKPASVDTPQAELDAQYDLTLRIYRQLDCTAKSINRMRDLRAQLDGLAKRTKDRADGAELAAEAEKLRDRVLEIEKLLEVPDLRPGWADRINNGIRLFEKLAGLTDLVHMGDYRPTDSAEAAFTELRGKIEEVIAQFETLVSGDLATFNARAASANIGATIA